MKLTGTPGDNLMRKITSDEVSSIPHPTNEYYSRTTSCSTIYIPCAVSCAIKIRKSEMLSFEDLDIGSNAHLAIYFPITKI